jgi:hypothetical protein
MRCPVCRAADNHTAQCRRCKADLSLLVRLERTRANHLAIAEFHAGRNNAQACLASARRAHALYADRESQRLLAVGFLLSKDFAGARRAFESRQADLGS